MPRQYLGKFLLLLGLFLAGTAHAQGTDPITVSDLLQIRQLSDVTASPDGRFVAYAVRSVVEDEEDELRYRSQIWIVAAHVAEKPRQVTFHEDGASSPAWHPDGDRLAFVRQIDGTPQIFEISIYGGEARQLTRFAHGASSPQWAPTGERLLFSTTLTTSELDSLAGMAPSWSDERPGRSRGDVRGQNPNPDGTLGQVRAWLAENEDESNPRVFTRLNLQGELALEPEPKFQHYFSLEIEQGETRLVTRRHYGFSGAEWLPDGNQILVSGYPEEADHPDRERDRDLFLVDVADGRMQRLLNIEQFSLSSPTLSPDGNHVSFLARDLDDPGYAQSELGVFALDGRSPPEFLTTGFDRNVGSARWSSDNWFLYFTAPSNGGFPLFRLAVNEGKVAVSNEPQALDEEAPDSLAADSLAADSLAALARDFYLAGEVVRRGLQVERLTGLDQGIRSFDLTRATAYFVLTEVTNPFELYASTMDFGRLSPISDHNTSWLRSKRISIPVSFGVERDDYTIPYWVMSPTFHEPGRRYPVMLEIHGGPAAMWGPGEATMWHEFQVMAAKGYAIVFSNPRGSGGYGNAYRRANYQDWGDGPASDVLAVLDDAMRRQRWIDPGRQVVTGGSYAGYLTAWIVSQDSRFRAAVAQRGVYDLDTFFGEGNAWRLIPSHFGGYPWEQERVLSYNSPLTHVDQIRTPLLIMHADNDLRTGVIQSEVLYRSLKVLGRPVEYVRYPDAGHDLSRSGHPKQRMDRLLRIYEFMERYVGQGR